MEEKTGTYKITEYTVSINSISQLRQLITYYKLDGEEITAERYYGEARPGFIQQD